MLLNRSPAPPAMPCHAPLYSTVHCTAVQYYAVLLCNILASYGHSPPSLYHLQSKPYSYCLDYSCPLASCVHFTICNYCLILYRHFPKCGESVMSCPHYCPLLFFLAFCCTLLSVCLSTTASHAFLFPSMRPSPPSSMRGCE